MTFASRQHIVVTHHSQCSYVSPIDTPNWCMSEPTVRTPLTHLTVSSIRLHVTPGGEMNFTTGRTQNRVDVSTVPPTLLVHAQLWMPKCSSDALSLKVGELYGLGWNWPMTYPVFQFHPIAQLCGVFCTITIKCYPGWSAAKHNLIFRQTLQWIVEFSS